MSAEVIPVNSSMKAQDSHKTCSLVSRKFSLYATRLCTIVYIKIKGWGNIYCVVYNNDGTKSKSMT